MLVLALRACNLVLFLDIRNMQFISVFWFGMCREAATVMLAGQVADGMATIIVGQLVINLTLVANLNFLSWRSATCDAMHEEVDF